MSNPGIWKGDGSESVMTRQRRRLAFRILAKRNNKKVSEFPRLFRKENDISYMQAILAPIEAQEKENRAKRIAERKS